MHIQCTKALLNYIKPEMTNHQSDNDIYAWHAHIVKRSNKNLLVVMHDLSRFTIVFYGIKRSHLKDLAMMISIAISNCMYFLGFTDIEIDTYLNNQPEKITFNQTKNRTLIARLNKSVENADYVLGEEGYFEDSIEQPHASVFCSELLVSEKNENGYYVPFERFKEYLELYRSK